MFARGRGRGACGLSRLASVPTVHPSSQSEPAHATSSVCAHPASSESTHQPTSHSMPPLTSTTHLNCAGSSKSNKGRGKSRNLGLSKILDNGVKIPIEICKFTGVAIGVGSEKFTTEVGIVTRQLAPLNVPKWKDISDSDKTTLIGFVRNSFTLSNEPYVDQAILNLMKDRYKSYRHDLRKYFRSHSTLEAALANPPENIASNVWEYLCTLWSDEKYKEKCEKNKQNRSKLRVLHTAGSKAFAKIRFDERDPNTEEEVGLVETYRKTHYSESKKAWVSDEAELRYNKLKEKEAEIAASGLAPLSDEQLSQAVFGVKSGYLIGLGRGAKPSSSSSGQRTRAQLERDVEEARRETTEQRRINDELVARVQSLESESMQVNSKLDFLMQQLSGQGEP